MNIHTEEKHPVHNTVAPLEDPSNKKKIVFGMNNDEDFLSHNTTDRIDRDHDRYPHCVVWTPIPLLTWIFPFIGHMGIARTDGVIRDFAGPYYVSEDDMAFGRPTKYLQLDLNRIPTTSDSTNVQAIWDKAVEQASEEYKKRMHNLCCDNCHSHVAMALNTMDYNRKHSYNMISLAIRMFFCGKYVSFLCFLRSWIPFLIIIGIILAIVLAVTLTK